MPGWKDKVIEPRKKMSREDIIKKIERIEEEEYYINRCFHAKVCPGCGRDMSLEEINTLFVCKCGFKASESPNPYASLFNR